MAKVHDNATDLITFARSSSGTALRRVGYGDELVTNGGFDTDTSGWTDASEGTGSTSWYASGALSLNNPAGSPLEEGIAYQVITTIVGQVYTLAVSKSGGNSIIQIGNGSGGSQVYQSGNNTVDVLTTFIAISPTTYITARNFNVSTPALVDNISVREVIFDRATDPLVLFNHPDDTPRIEYGSDGSLKGLLIEEQRTNLITHSEDTYINYSAEISKQSDAVTWLTGATTADLIVPTTANSQHYFGYSSPYSAGTSNETYSFFAKASGYHRFRVYLANQTGGYQADFDLSAETATNTGAAVGQSIENFGDGWFRCSMTFLSTKGNPYPSVKIFDNSGNQTFSGDGTSGIYFAGHQLEEGSFATSYIPTSGSQQTRSADVASIPVSAFGYNQDAGTVVVEAQVADTSVSNAGDLRIKTTVGHDITNSGSRVGGFPAGSYVVYSPTTNILMRVDTVLGDGQPYKAAYGIAESNSAISVNGSSVVIDQTTTLAGNTASLFELGKNFGFLNGHIKSLKYYPRRLTNAQLQELTA